jgi:hypothetical protein
MLPNSRSSFMTSRPAWLRLALSASCCLVLGGRLPPRAAASSESPLPAAVALIEWQFPTDQPPSLPIHPQQRRWLSCPQSLAFGPSLYPNLSEESKKQTAYGLNRLTKHGERCAHAYAAGRVNFTPPFLLNVSTATPQAVKTLIQAGVRIFCFSIGGRGEDARLLAWVESAARDNRDVLFVVSTPHISGNSISVEKLAEVPSVLATRGISNILLVGVLRFYEDNLQMHRDGRRLGSADNPFSVDNQPVNTDVPQIFMMNDMSIREFVDGISGTSVAAPQLASLLGLIAEELLRQGKPVTATTLQAELRRITHRTHAREKSGEVHVVSYFTQDTVLLNAGRPLISKAIWGELLNDAPAPLRISSRPDTREQNDAAGLKPLPRADVD